MDLQKKIKLIKNLIIKKNYNRRNKIYKFKDSNLIQIISLDKFIILLSLIAINFWSYFSTQIAIKKY